MSDSILLDVVPESADRVWTPPAHLWRRAVEPHRNTLALFFSRIEIDGETGCWIWRGSKSADCYGFFHGESAHRTAYRWFVGPIQPPYVIDHLCRRPYCVNPAHLEAVTQSQNVRRGADARGFCKRGHQWIDSNIRWVNTNHGRVRTCAECFKLHGPRRRERERLKRLAAGEPQHGA